MQHQGHQRSVGDGPFVETGELIAGLTISQVWSDQEAVDWSMRLADRLGESCTVGTGTPLRCELDELAPSEAIDRFRALATVTGLSGEIDMTNPGREANDGTACPREGRP
mgnify:CR=1 FL=1